MATAFVQFARRTGGAWIKAGQLLGTRRDLFSDDAIRVLSQLRDQVGGRPPRKLKTLLARRLEGTGHRLLSVDPSPLASGSVAFIHLATLSGIEGTLAVKVRRTNVERKVAQDLRLLRRAAALMGRWPRFAHIPLERMVETLATAISRQVNFANEVDNTLKFQRAFAGTSTNFPRIYHHISSEDVIFMDYENNIVSIDAVTTVANLEGMYENLVRSIYKMLFVDGFFHCDVHPGNVFFRDDGDCMFLDCGLAAELTAEERDNFSDFFLCIAFNRGARAADMLLRTALRVPASLDRATFRYDIASVVARVAGLRAREFKVAVFVSDLFEQMRRHSIISAPEFVWMITVLLTIEGPVKAHYPDMDFQRLAVDVIVDSRFETMRT